MKTPNWIINSDILESRNNVGNFEKAFQNTETSYEVHKYIPFSEDQNYGDLSYDRPNVIYGSINYVSKCRLPIIPGAMGFTYLTNCNFYYPQYPTDWFLNNDYICLPFGDILRKKDYIKNVFGNHVFIRPVSGFKSFAGFDTSIEDFEYEINSYQSLNSVSKDEMCLISSGKNIDAEYRFLILKKEVIDGSQYRRNNVLDIRHDYSDEALHMSEKVAKHWQPDDAFTVDIAETSNGAKLIEINSFCCAGWYACDTEKVVRAVNKFAIEEFYGQ